MEKGIDKLTGELAKLADQLSKAIPKGYTELVKEYAYSHLMKAILSGVAVIALVIILVLSIVGVIKYIKYYTKNQESFTFEQKEFHSNLQIGGTVIGIFGLGFLIVSTVVACCNVASNLEHFVAPNYYMLKTIIGK